MRIFPVIPMFVLLLSGYAGQLSAQEASKLQPVIGIRYTANYNSLKTNAYNDNFRVLSSIPSVFVKFNNHDFHFGIVFSHLYNASWLDNILYEPDALGLNIGYRYNSMEIRKNLRIFGQLDASVIKLKYTESQLGGNNYSTLEQRLWAGNFSMGAGYRLADKLHLSAGIGLGTTTGLYGYFNGIIFTPFLGIEYRFNCSEKK